MLNQEEIANQQKLLETYRRTLADWIEQQAKFSILTPSYIRHGIRETREDIRRIKATLRDAGQIVEDWPNDEETTIKFIAPAPKPFRHPKRIIFIGTVIVLVLAASAGYYLYQQAQQQMRLQALRHFNAGKDYLDEGDDNQAAAEFEQAIDLIQDNAEFYKYHGDALFGQKNYYRAIMDYDRPYRLKRLCRGVA